MAERTVTRIVWNFQEGIPIPVIPPVQRFMRRPVLYCLYNAVGELFHQEGNLWFDIHLPHEKIDSRYWGANGPRDDFWVDLFDKETHARTFKIWHSDDSFLFRHWLRFKFEVINGQNFTDTALEYGLLIFQRIGILDDEGVKNHHPFIGKVTQQSNSPRFESSWIDTALYRFYDAKARLANKK
jgi:hypothetical protein